MIEHVTIVKLTFTALARLKNFQNFMRNEKNNKKYQQNPEGYYTTNITIRGKRCRVKIINESCMEYKLEVESKDKLSEEFLDFLAYYLQTEGFYDEAKKHNLEWN